jgi:hypothetical protein
MLEFLIRIKAHAYIAGIAFFRTPANTLAQRNYSSSKDVTSQVQLKIYANFNRVTPAVPFCACE